MKEFVCNNETIERLVKKTKKKISDFIHGAESEKRKDETGCQKNVLLHGVGIMLPMARRELESDGWTIPYIIDDTKSLWGTFKDGIEIVSREDKRIQKYHYIIATITHIKELMDTYKNTGGILFRLLNIIYASIMKNILMLEIIILPMKNQSLYLT